ncbi:pentapeptide repeat-containing protein [Paraburkholderia sp. HP33-1]|uniref:pentapeptide repeat-containing protein n=1 Tax=Paraburkholderia sp. HP33-1 TaxID=2883243 RepID=UPI001F18CB19|nr:pentapeptide repeat-containing protein [Paraburkholderia sp. HP33-1]
MGDDTNGQQFDPSSVGGVLKSPLSDDQEAEPIKRIRESFESVYDGPNRFYHEYTLQQAANNLKIPVDDYRALYELRHDTPFPPFPQAGSWKRIPGVWLSWWKILPGKQRWLLLQTCIRKGFSKAIKGGAALAVVAAIAHYLWTIPERAAQAEAQVEQSRFQAWQLIISANGQRINGGRIEALESLARQNVNLGGLEAPDAYFVGINLFRANLHDSNFSRAILGGANLEGAGLQRALLEGTYFGVANLRHAMLPAANLKNAMFLSTNLQGAYLRAANLEGTKFPNANLESANLTETKGLLSEALDRAHLCHTMLPPDLKDLADRDCGKPWSAIPRRP